ncbi:MAG TPA: helix-turn-helix domain-containing protein [Chloroflexota bacterium]|jgi:DNA-binding HxlR family transcriptional regulator
MPASLAQHHRSGCPISLALEVFGDRWTLLIVRDLMFAGKRHFRELLHSDERIASNILADRLNMLLEQGIISRSSDPTHKQKAVYSLTEKGIALLPVLAQIGIWSRRFLPVDQQLAATTAELEAGGPPLWEQWMSTLRGEQNAEGHGDTNQTGAR